MKIIFLMDSVYPDYTGGIENWIYNISNRLINYYDIDIISQKKFTNDNRYGKYVDNDNRINIHRITTLRNIRGIKILMRWRLRWINQYFASFKTRKKLKQIIEKNSNEKIVIIAMDTLFMARAGSWAKNNYKNVKFICSVRCPHAELTAECYPFLRKALFNMEKNNLSNADIIWANGWDTQSLLNVKGFKSIVMKNGLDISRINNIDKNLFLQLPINKGYNVITIGTLIDIKGYNELIKAISILHQKYGMRVNLIALGKGTPTKYQQLSKRLNITEFVNFVGENKNTIEIAYYCDVAACLSGGSGLAMACLESMCSRTPVIAWDTPVYQQMIKHKQNGYLVEEKNIEKLAEGIRWLLLNKKESDIIGKNGYEFVKTFDWSVIISEIVEQLENLLVNN